jgi:hypothetical protein
MTRARCGLIIIGNANCLKNGSSIWNRWFNHIDKLIINYNDFNKREILKSHNNNNNNTDKNNYNNVSKMNTSNTNFHRKLNKGSNNITDSTYRANKK